MADIICVENVSRRFGEIRALTDVSLTVGCGQVHAILGHNGSGKSTLLRILLGLLRPTSGKMTCLGFDTWDQYESQKAKAQMGVLLEDNGLYEHFTGWTNLELTARIYRLAPEIWKPRAREILEAILLERRMHEKVANWSAGMKRKLALVRALVHRPRVLVLDEPTAGLDAMTKYVVREYLKRVAAEEETTILVATQDLFEAERMATHVSILREGRVMSCGRLSDLLADTHVRRLRLKSHVLLQDIESVHKVLRVSEDALGTTVLVHNGTGGHREIGEGGADLPNGVVELPPDLEDVYIAMAEQWSDRDAF